jgi:hypothetical protein
MKKEQIAFFATLLVGAAAAYYFLVYKKNVPKTKADYVNNIANKVKTNPVTLSSFDLGYLQAWSDALDNNIKVFTYNGKLYDGFYGTAKI